MDDRIAVRISEAVGGSGGAMPSGGEVSSSADLPPFLVEPFAAAMADAMLLPVALSLVGVVAAFFIGRPVDTGAWAQDV
ncbi:hypothetical protein GCM10009625_15420 [Brachybacterium fresconis]